MAEKGEHAYSVTWRPGGPGDPLLTCRADSEEELAERMHSFEALVKAHFESSPAQPVEAPPQANQSATVPELPREALQVMAASGKKLCTCDAGWWDNRQTKTGRQPDFKCKKCGQGVWLT